jgi:hypothetical protein
MKNLARALGLRTPTDVAVVVALNLAALAVAAVGSLIVQAIL